MTIERIRRPCAVCGEPANYDTFEDCYLCMPKNPDADRHLTYPIDYDESDNPDAGIWHICEQKEQ